MGSKARSQQLSVLELVFCITAFVLMWAGAIWCKFIKFTDVSGTSEPISLQFGIWYYQFWSLVSSTDGTFIMESCHQYPADMTIDASWKAARAFSILAFIFGIIVLIVSMIKSCAYDPDKYSALDKWMPPAYFLTGTFQALTLLVLSSDLCKDNSLMDEIPMKEVLFPETCSIANGAKLIISATAFWVAASFASFMAQKAKKAETDEEIDAGLREPLNLSA